MKQRDLTIKETKFVRALIEGGNGTDAAEQIYNVKNRQNATSLSIQIKKRPPVQLAIKKALEAKGLTTDKIAELLAQNMIEGAGVKATARDSLRAIELWGKFTGAFNPAESKESYKATVSKLSTKDLLIEIEKRQAVSVSLLQELQP